MIISEVIGTLYAFAFFNVKNSDTCQGLSWLIDSHGASNDHTCGGFIWGKLGQSICGLYVLFVLHTHQFN